MKIFQSNLPLVLILNKDQPNELKKQGIFSKISAGNIYLNIQEFEGKLSQNQKCHIVFYLDQFEFEFETIIAIVESNDIAIRKPVTIKRKKIREGKRLAINIPCLYTLWTQDGRYSGNINNISSTGVRLTTAEKVKSNSIVTLSFKIRVEEKNYKVVCQAIVKWCNKIEDAIDEDQAFESGIKFTTLSKENMSRIEILVFK